MGGPGPTPSVTVAEALDVFRERDEPCTPLTASEVADALGCARRTAHRKLKQLVERGDLETKKVGARSRVWWLPTDRPTEGENVAKAVATEPAHNQFANFVSVVEDYAIFTLDPDGHVVSWNEGAKRIKGYTEEEILGEHYATFYTDDSVEQGVPTKNLAAATEQGHVEDEGWRVRKDGSKFWANAVITAVHDDDGTLQGFTKVTRDMTEQMYTERERRLNRSVSAAIARAPTIEEGLEAVIEDICELTEWEYGEAWLPADTGIERIPATYADSDRLERFADASLTVDFEPGEGIVGRVWQSGSPEWIQDVSTVSEKTFKRVGLASEVGCKAILGVPVVSEDSVAAVLLFAMTERRAVDDRLTNIVESAAAELGGLVSRKQAEVALRRERELLDQILEASPVGIGVLEPDGTITRTNPRGVELLGMTEGAAEEIAADERVVLDEEGEPIPPEERPFATVFENGEPVYEWTCQIEQPDGERRWVSINAAPIRDQNGEIERVVASGEDITKVKMQAGRLARQREELESELREVYERVEDAFYALDTDWRFTYLNDRAEDLLERSEEDVIGESIWRAFPEAAETKVGEKYEEAMETQEPVAFEQFYDPLDIWVEIHAYPSESGLSVYFRDVTARKEREQQLERYETIIETMQDGVYTIDPNGRFQMVNGAYEELTGYSREELIGSPASMVVDESTVEEATALEEALLSGERETTILEAQIQRADGEWVNVEGSFSIIPSEAASDHGYRRVGVIRDITDRKEYERELRRYETLIEESTDVNAIVDAEGTIEYITPSVEYVLGYEPGELMGESTFDFIHEDDRNRVQQDFAALVEGVEDRKTTEFRFEHTDDSWVWLESRGRDLRADPRIDGLVVYTREITDRKEYELELESRARQQAVIADLGRDALSNQDLDDLFAKATRLVAETLDTEFCKVLDLAVDESELLLRQGVGWRDGLVGSTTVPADDDESQAGYTLRAEAPVVVTDFKDETRFSGPELLTAHDVESGISAVIGSNENPWGILGVHDTSTRSFSDEDVNFVKSVSNVLAAAIERQTYQRELEDLVEKLEESNQRLEQFAYITSHDLQEPLRMVSSYLRLLENRYTDQLDEDAEEFIEFAVDGAERMRQMINDLLEYSRLDTRAEPFEPTDTRTVVENALANLQVQVEENDADIDVDRLPTVTADSNQLEQVFQNLVSNAIKYRGEDPPEIEISADRDDDEWVFQVADNGIGIDPEHTDRIFDVFDRLHTHEEYPGTGIGLALCQKIVERHGGDIWVESEPGVGSTFYFSIPADETVRDQRSSSGTTETRMESR